MRKNRSFLKLVLFVCLFTMMITASATLTACRDNGDSSESSQGGGGITYTVTFLNYDDSVISSTVYNRGDKITIPETPTRPEDEVYTYVFKGWDKNPAIIAQSDATYKAEYHSNYKVYKATFVNYDGTVIAEKSYHYGDAVSAPTNVKRSADNTYTYTFIGWDNDVSSIKKDTVYTAQFEAKYIEYKITFVADSRTVSQQTYHYGDTVTVPANPTKNADKMYTYTFAQWDSAITVVTGHKTYTAVFNKHYIDYTITFAYPDGVIIEKQTYHYGDTVNVPANPEKQPTAQYSYTFTGWSDEISTVNNDMTYYAVFSTTLNRYTLTVNYLNEAGAKLFDSHIREMDYGTEYSVTSPTKNLYTPSQTVVHGRLTNDTTVNVVYVYLYKSGTLLSDGYTVIADAEYLFAEDFDLTKNYRLYADINCSGIAASPIGSETEPFSGILDGNGYVISNLTLSSDATCVGLFAKITGKLNNVYIQNAKINATVAGDAYVGVLAAKSQGATLTDCTVSGSKITASGVAKAWIGGIVGEASATTLNNTDAAVTFNVTASSYVYLAGVVGKLTANSSEYTLSGADATATVSVTASGNLIMGGIVADVSTAPIADSSATLSGSFATERTATVGGIAGNKNGSAVSNTTASVTFNQTTCTADKAYIGGAFGSSTNGSATNCTATLKLSLSASGMTTVGGFAGSNLGSVSGCTATVSVTVKTDGTARVGGFFGSDSTTLQTVSNCSASGSLKVTANSEVVGTFVGLCNEETNFANCSSTVTIQ